MGLLTILKKMKQKEKEVRLLMLYPFLEKIILSQGECVKVNDVCSNFLDLYKGVPQGSILGPVIFNIFLNDIFYFVTNCDLYNYADDNTLSYASSNIIEIKQVLETKVSSHFGLFPFRPQVTSAFCNFGPRRFGPPKRPFGLSFGLVNETFRPIMFYFKINLMKCRTYHCKILNLSRVFRRAALENISFVRN